MSGLDGVGHDVIQPNGREDRRPSEISQQGLDARRVAQDVLEWFEKDRQLRRQLFVERSLHSRRSRVVVLAAVSNIARSNRSVRRRLRGGCTF